MYGEIIEMLTQPLFISFIVVILLANVLVLAFKSKSLIGERKLLNIVKRLNKHPSFKKNEPIYFEVDKQIKGDTFFKVKTGGKTYSVVVNIFRVKRIEEI